MRSLNTGVTLWLATAAVTTALCGLVYLAVQQALRASANDPQIQMAEDGAYALANGATPESIVPQGKIDMARSLAPFVIVFDPSGAVLASSADLHGKLPHLPQGVLDFTLQHGE